MADAGFQHGGQNIHYLEKRMAEQKGQQPAEH
jgi:acetyl-CoA carboxylase biotin carboxylase subunit